jgi:general secretion pathway protein B
MSFILDALKKSETERQSQSIPGLVDAGAARARARLPAWAVALGALLLVNLLVLSIVMTRSFLRAPQPPRAAVARPGEPTSTAADDADSGAVDAAHGIAPNAAAPNAAAPGAAASGTAAPAAHFSPMDVPTVYAPEIPLSNLPPPPAAAPAAPLKSMSPKSSDLTPLHRRDPLLTDQDYKPGDDETLPTINELTTTGAQALPELHLDVHVYSTRPAERFVYVNMRKYHEGATLEEGPTIERIRRDGVILNYQGLRFLLPRQ